MARRKLDLQISGLNDDDVRRWRLPRDRGRTLFFKVIPFIGILWVAPNLVPESSIDQGGQVVRGDRILLIQDTSGSMGSYQAIVDQRLAALRQAGAYSDIGCQLSNNEFPDFVACVIRQTRQQDIDGLYVFADFQWSFTPEGLNEVRHAVEASGVRLYLDTIDADPPPEFQALVESSGGAVIHTPKS